MTFPSIFATHARTANPVPDIVALSVPTHRFTAASASSGCTGYCHCIAWRYFNLFNTPLPSRLYCFQRWQNNFFNRTSLYLLGLIYHTGHNGNPCPTGSSPQDLIIIDLNGWHKVRIRFCTCDTNTPWDERYRQLLRIRWYPASFNRPRTAFSFDLLDTYHKITLQGKLNLYDFYLAIMQKSDNQGRSKIMVSDL